MSITGNQISALVQDSMESLKAIEVLNWLQSYVGKPITTRLATAANKEFPGEDFQISRCYGMTHLENATHRQLRYSSSHSKDRAMWRKSINLLLAHSEGAVPLAASYLTEHNTNYTVAPRRNKTRTESLQYADSLAQAINEYHKAGARLAEAMKPFSEDRYAIDEAFTKAEVRDNA